MRASAHTARRCGEQVRLAGSVGWSSFERLVDRAAELPAVACDLADEAPGPMPSV